MQGVYCVYAMEWRGLSIEVRHAPDWCGSFCRVYGRPLAHLEIDAHGTPLPCTETGYRSHFDQRGDIEAHGGPLEFVRLWLDHEAALPRWRAYDAEHRQLSLF